VVVRGRSAAFPPATEYDIIASAGRYHHIRGHAPLRRRDEATLADPVSGRSTKTPKVGKLKRNGSRLKEDDRQPEERLFECKVYYEDTDCMGVVYHANYVKYLERARTEYVEDRLSSIAGYHESGDFFMVHKLEIVFHAPARLGDQLVIRTWIENTTKFRIVVRQIVTKKG